MRKLARAGNDSFMAIWVIAALVGRWLSQRALAPVTQMVAMARSISAADLSRRLPSTGVHDELDELGSAFNDLLTRLQDSFSRQQRFTAEASHQLRTPLTAMLGQIEVALPESGPQRTIARCWKRPMSRHHVCVKSSKPCCFYRAKMPKQPPLRLRQLKSLNGSTTTSPCGASTRPQRYFVRGQSWFKSLCRSPSRVIGPGDRQFARQRLQI